MNKKFSVELHIVGAKENSLCSENIKYIEWSEANEVDLIGKFDIGVMPLENTPWELGKCSYKLIQYMGCGLPVVASAIGMNKEVIQEGKNGFLVEGENAWIEKLSSLINDAELRIAMGNAGRETVMEKYNLQNNISILASVLKDNKETRVVFNTVNGRMVLE